MCNFAPNNQRKNWQKQIIWHSFCQIRERGNPATETKAEVQTNT